MKKILLLLFSLLGLLSARAQNDVTVAGTVRELSVGPDQSIWLTTGMATFTTRTILIRLGSRICFCFLKRII